METCGLDCMLADSIFTEKAPTVLIIINTTHQRVVSQMTLFFAFKGIVIIIYGLEPMAEG